MNDHPIFLVRGIDWTPRSAGIRCLHTLCKRLKAVGEEAYLSDCRAEDGSKVELIDTSILEGRKLVCIEPEVTEVCGDWADLTVRWLLNSPGKVSKDQSAAWPARDLLAHFDRRFAVKDSIPLAVPHVDRAYFHNDNNEMDHKRDVDCFYAKKAIASGVRKQCPVGALDVSPDAGHIEPGDWKNLAKLFRRTRTFYTMEDTATSIEAALCGAHVEYILNHYQPTLPPIDDFVAWYGDLEKRSVAEMGHFIDVCYKRLGVKRRECVAV